MPCVISGEPKQAVTDTNYLRRFPGRMSGLAAALLADVKFVDCGSLDVLVYCQDDLAVGAPGDWRLAGGVDGP
jgi:hypothetical protein